MKICCWQEYIEASKSLMNESNHTHENTGHKKDKELTCLESVILEV